MLIFHILVNDFTNEPIVEYQLVSDPRFMKTHSTHSFCLLAACLLCGFYSHGIAATVYTFQNGAEVTSGGSVYSSETDNYLKSTGKYANFNYGSTGLLAAGYASSSIYRSILRFDDLSSYIGSDESVQSASLTLRNANGGGQIADLTIEVYVIKAGNAGWVAGTADGVKQIGSSNWNYQIAEELDASSTEWVGGAGLGEPGEGYEATYIGTITAVDGSTNLMTLEGLASVVQGWLDQPSSNAGLLLRVSDEGVENLARIYSGDVSTISYRPLLEVTTVAIPEPTPVTLAFLGAVALVTSFRYRRLRA